MQFQTCDGETNSWNSLVKLINAFYCLVKTITQKEYLAGNELQTQALDDPYKREIELEQLCSALSDNNFISKLRIWCLFSDKSGNKTKNNKQICFVFSSENAHLVIESSVVKFFELVWINYVSFIYNMQRLKKWWK